MSGKPFVQINKLPHNQNNKPTFKPPQSVYPPWVWRQKSQLPPKVPIPRIYDAAKRI